MTVAADLEEGEVGGCERQAVVAPYPRKLHSVLTQGWGLHIGLCPMAYLEVVKSKPVHHLSKTIITTTTNIILGSPRSFNHEDFPHHIYPIRSWRTVRLSTRGEPSAGKYLAAQVPYIGHNHT